jgi:2-polyprenyl-6-hydroxyphenyl methylase/3-demethylubiquinone-9 3-methyltransferase
MGLLKLTGVATTSVHGREDVRGFFDRCASAYAEQHGHPGRLLEYRLGLVRAHARLRAEDDVLDVGCGPGDHLLALASQIRRSTGVDLSPGMIDVARARLRGSPNVAHVTFAVDDASELASVPTASVDVVLCIGVIEHVLDKPATLASIRRTLRASGRFFCLTPNGDYLWYRHIAPRLGLATRHLSTDAFLTRDGLVTLLRRAGFERVEAGPWTFVPKGDMPRVAGWALMALDLVGRATGVHSLRGGLWTCAWAGPASAAASKG